MARIHGHGRGHGVRGGHPCPPFAIKESTGSPSMCSSDPLSIPLRPSPLYLEIELGLDAVTAFIVVITAATVASLAREDVQEDHRVWLLPFREPARAGVSRSRRRRRLLRSSAHISSPWPRQALLRPSRW